MLKLQDDQSLIYLLLIHRCTSSCNSKLAIDAQDPKVVKPTNTLSTLIKLPQKMMPAAFLPYFCLKKIGRQLNMEILEGSNIMVTR